MAAITLTSVKRRSGATVILRGVDLHVREGELMVIVGSSGSGKTSVIRAVAGLDELDSGTVTFDGEDFTSVPVAERDVGIVFQENVLIPGRTARANVSFPLKVRAMGQVEIRKRVNAEARALGIEHIMERWPKQLSAGHQQLVQIARAMVRVPRVLLLDEPMANLDPPTRRRLRNDLKELQRGYGVTTIYATNDPVEAMAMADRIAVIEDGRIRQVGTPEALYTEPVDANVAWLTGSVSFLDAVVERDAEGYWLAGDGFRVRAWSPELGRHVEDKVRLGVRPDGLSMQPDSTIRAVVSAASFETGTPVTRLFIGGASVAVAPIDQPTGADVGITFDRYLIFDTAGDLIAAVG